MSKVPCVNTIELNRYLDGLDAAEARDEEITRIAVEEIEPEIYESKENCESIAELLQDADNNDDVLFVKACIVGGYSSQPQSVRVPVTARHAGVSGVNRDRGSHKGK